MRRCSLWVAVVLFVVLPTRARAQLPIGLRGGVNLSKFVGGSSEADAKRGLDLGLAFSPLRVGPVSLVVEGYYRQKGAKTLENAVGGTEPPQSVELGLDYVEIPILARVDLPLAGPLRLYLQGGPAFGWQLDCGVTLDLSGAQSSPTTSCDDLLGGGFQDTLRSYELGVAGGGGLELVVLRGMGAVTLDARVTRGLTGLSNDDQAGSNPKNQSVSLMLGYTLHPGIGGMP